MFTRYILTSAVGGSITLALFFVMQALVASEGSPESAVPSAQISFTMERDETPPNARDRTPPEREEVVREPDLPPIPFDPRPRPEFSDGGTGVRIAREPWKDPQRVAAPTEGDLLPIVRAAPRYPPRELANGVEGWVLLEFTVTETGTVADVRVLDSEPEATFDAAAVRALKRWKYKPRVENGEAVERTGVKVVLRFELPE